PGAGGQPARTLLPLAVEINGIHPNAPAEKCHGQNSNNSNAGNMNHLKRSLRKCSQILWILWLVPLAADNALSAPDAANVIRDERVNADIAILDNGIDLTHPDLNVYRAVSFSPSNTTGNDGHGHGTHVAGTAAALDNGIGVVGVAPGARLWAIKVLDDSGSGTLSAILSGIDYVTQNASQIEV